MENAQRSFISSTFWTERIGPTAALATLDEMERIKSWKIINKNGLKIMELWNELSKTYNLKIKISGLPALCSFSFESKNSQEYKTYITQEMLKSNILASNSIYSSISHTEKVFQFYYEKIDKIFRKIKKCEEGYDINKLLKFKIANNSFGRIN